MLRSILIGAFAFGAMCDARAHVDSAPLYRYQDVRTRWASPENPDAAPGAGAVANGGAKGHAYDGIAAGASRVLARIDGPGVIDRIWMTFEDRSPTMLRSLRLAIYWDDAREPAVSVPVGDLFGAGAGALVPIETAVFASPEARSFVLTLPMPFRRNARVVLFNDSDRALNQLFHDVDFRQLRTPDPDALYFHAWWHREHRTTLGKPFELLPRVRGRGRFLGTIVTTITAPEYGDTWWGEGEVKFFLDDDRARPTLVGTGTEDYIGTAWGQGRFVHRYAGAPVADPAGGRWTFYRFHVPDPIFFAHAVRTEWQQIGGAPRARVLELLARGVPLVPVSIDPGHRSRFVALRDAPSALDAPGLPDGWVNFERSDDVSAVALFYLDRPANGLPAIAGVAQRTADLRPAPANGAAHGDD